MTADDPTDKDVKIYAPDRALQGKVGTANLDQMFSPQVIAEAQGVIAQAADELYNDSLTLTGTIGMIADRLRQEPAQTATTLPEIIAQTFALKNKLGQCGYDLAASLARSLQYYCEQLGREPLTGKDMDIIAWHIAAIRHLLGSHLKSKDNDIGKAIIAELQRLLPGRDL